MVGVATRNCQKAILSTGRRIAMHRYSLTPDVFICLVNGHFVFLDLKADKYLALNRAQSEIISRLLSGWEPIGQTAQIPGGASDGCTSDLLKDMVSYGLITRDSVTGKVATSPNIETPSIELSVDEHLETGVRISPLDVWRFFSACVRASANLRWLSTEKIVRRVKRRKRGNEKNSESFDPDTATRVVSIFYLLRPFYVRRYLCIFDSLALVHFLSQYGIYPTWVYGVKSEPFEAHCWVQERGFAFNDSIERIQGFTPIMSI